MAHIAYYDYDDAPEIVISDDRAVWLSLAGYMPHKDRHNGTDNIYYPIPENNKEVWQLLTEEAA
jgi:hypothetical protein